MILYPLDTNANWPRIVLDFTATGRGHHRRRVDFFRCFFVGPLWLKTSLLKVRPSENANLEDTFHEVDRKESNVGTGNPHRWFLTIRCEVCLCDDKDHVQANHHGQNGLKARGVQTCCNCSHRGFGEGWRKFMVFLIENLLCFIDSIFCCLHMLCICMGPCSERSVRVPRLGPSGKCRCHLTGG